jgi:hypothetical protein
MRAADASRRALVSRVALLMLILCATTGCYRFQPVETQTTPTHEQDPREVRAAVLRGLASQRFDPVTEEPGRIYAVLWARKWNIIVAVDYASWQYAIHYVSSQGLPTRNGRDGQPLVHHRYHRMVDALRQQIHRELGPVEPAGVAAMGPPGTTTITTTTTITPSPGTQVDADGELVVEVDPTRSP